MLIAFLKLNEATTFYKLSVINKSQVKLQFYNNNVFEIVEN